jgi:hypothetical protein
MHGQTPTVGPNCRELSTASISLCIRTNGVANTNGDGKQTLARTPRAAATMSGKTDGARYVKHPARLDSINNYPMTGLFPENRFSGKLAILRTRRVIAFTCDCKATGRLSPIEPFSATRGVLR